MIRAFAILLAVIVIGGGGAFWLATTPRMVTAAELPNHTPDLANGERMFWAGGCESCHAAEDASGQELLKLGGGLQLVTEFGTFHVPNISPDPQDGIGAWTLAEFVTAMKLGVGPGGEHLYPAFPYASYQRMRVEDIIDLKAFMDTLPLVAQRNTPNELKFPYSVRRGVGLWQLLHVDGKTFEPDPNASDIVNRGAYLANGAAHCGECHTPRSFDGGLITTRAFAGAQSLEGDGNVPNITPHADGIGDWSEADIVNFLTTGFTPDFDSAGGTMAAVVQNMARLPPEDVQAIAAYLKALPPLPSRARNAGS